MNRMALGLAVGAGYLLGRTKKMKLAFAVGTLVAGKKLPLSPRALTDLVQQQLLNNPQFKEIGDQLREDVRGVGKAATGAVLERGLDGISDRLHDRTLGVQDRLSGVIPGRVERDEPEREQEYDEEEYEEERPAPRKQARKTSGSRSSAEDEKSGSSRESGTSRSSRGGEASRTQKKAPAKKTASAGKSGAGKTTGTAKKTTGAAKTAARRTARAKGGRNDG